MHPRSGLHAGTERFLLSAEPIDPKISTRGMSLHRWIVIVALTGFLFAGGLGSVAPLTLCDDTAGDAHLASLIDDCCETQSPVDPSWQAADANCCLDLAPGLDAPVKSTSADAPAAPLPLAAVLQSVLARNAGNALPKLLDDPPLRNAGVVVMRC
jgi:hypothetical protein